MAGVRLLCGRFYQLLPELCRQTGQQMAAGRECLLLVPEQFTLQAERELVKQLHLSGFFSAQVMSPSRLAKKLLEELSPAGSPLLDERGRRIAVSRAVSQVEKRLTYYQRAANRPGFTEKLCALLSDMKQGGLTPETLEGCLHTDGMRADKGKLHDLCLIWNAYEKQLSGAFQDGQDRQAAVAARLDALRPFENACVFVYGFDTLPASLNAILLALARQAREVTCLLAGQQDDAPDAEIYAPVRQSIRHFLRDAKNAAIPARVDFLPYTPLPAREAISYLEKNLFATASAPFAGDADCIHRVLAATPYLEVRFAAQKMLEKHRDGMPFDQMTVVLGSMSAYSAMVNAVFTQYGIPFYMDEKLPAAAHPLCRFLLGAIRAATQGYKTEDVNAVMKSGFANLAQEEAFFLENYALAYGIKGSKWTRPFTRGSEGEIAQAEDMRQRLTAPLETLKKALAQADTAEKSLTALYNLLRDAQAYEKLQALEKQLLADNLTAQADQNRQIWRFLMDTLDQMNLLLSGSRAPSTHIAAWLENGIASFQLGALPPRPGQTQVGEIGHALPGHTRVLFVLGMQDGILQKDTQSLLTDEERQETEDVTGADLGLTDDKRTLLARLDLCRAVALAEEEIWFSCAQADTAGQSLRPLSVLKTALSALFPAVKTQPVHSVTDLGEPLCPGAVLMDAGVRLRACMGGEDAFPPQWQSAVNRLYNREDTRSGVVSLLSGLERPPAGMRISADTAYRLFRWDTLSVSQLESYAACPYRHFIQYGLRPQERKEWAVKPVDEGNFYHAVLSDFASRAGQEPGFPNLSEDRMDALFEAATKEPLESLALTPLSDSARTLSARAHILRRVHRAAWLYMHHAQVSDFETVMTEAAFGKNGSLPPVFLDLPNGRRAMVEGRIDRVDTWESGDETFVRVIDYKSSRKDLSAARAWWGLQLQLLIYLSSASKAVPDGVPAGAFYFQVTDPLVESKDDIVEAAEQTICRELRLKGIVLSETNVVGAMDHHTGSSMSKVFLKDGTTPAKNAQAITRQEMGSLLCLARKNAAQMADGISGGDVTIAPVQSGKASPCDYCEFRSICQVETRGHKRVLPDMDMETLKNKLDAMETVAENEPIEKK